MNLTFARRCIASLSAGNGKGRISFYVSAFILTTVIPKFPFAFKNLDDNNDQTLLDLSISIRIYNSYIRPLSFEIFNLREHFTENISPEHKAELPYIVPSSKHDNITYGLTY